MLTVDALKTLETPQVFVTGNSNKLREVKKILCSEATSGSLKIEVDSKALDRELNRLPLFLVLFLFLFFLAAAR